MNDKIGRSDMKVVILITTGFDEKETIQCMHHFQQAGLTTEIIGNKAGVIKGANGLKIQPDRTLVKLEETEVIRVIVLPGTVCSVMSMLVDPRAHQLFGTITAGGGHLFLMGQAEEAFIRAGFVDFLQEPRVVCDGQNDLIVFGRYMATLLDAR